MIKGGTTMAEPDKRQMNERISSSEYLVISCGQWDKDVSREEIWLNCPTCTPILISTRLEWGKLE